MSSDKLTINTKQAPPAQNSVQRKQNVALLEQSPSTTPAKAAEESSAPRASVDITAVANRIENYLKSVNRALEFKVDSESGRTVVTVRDAENGELIRQIPNEEVLRFAQLAEEQTVVLVSEKV